MAVLHTTEEQFYGPGMNVSACSLRILLYIRHRALRDWTDKKAIPKSEIMKATGIEKRTVQKCLKELETKNHIKVTRSKVGNVSADNVYELSPERYGTNYIYKPEKPSFKLIYGSKGHRSNDIPQETPAPSRTPEGEPHRTPEVAPSSTPVRQPKLLKSNTNLPSKNPLKEPEERTLSENREKDENGNIDLRSPEERERDRLIGEEGKRWFDEIKLNLLKTLPRENKTNAG